MNQITIAYANHRPETIRLSEKIMRDHQAIILEEPPDRNLPAMLEGLLEIDDYLLGQDIEYPAFSTEQCRLLIKLHRSGQKIIQSEPYYEHLFVVQDFFADGHAPDELDRSTEQYQVYLHEKKATGTLIDYYQANQTNDFDHIVEAVHTFAAADAARFKLRDRLRAREIAERLKEFTSVCIEAGPMHLLLYRYLRKSLPAGWQIRPRFVENHALTQLGCRTGVYGPGDALTAHYLLGNVHSVERRNLLAARALIFMKIIEKEEMTDWQNDFPHLKNESTASRLVRELSYQRCKILFAEIEGLSSRNAFDMVQKTVSDS